jgi:GNAT superfamily N-acetyltransferase
MDEGRVRRAIPRDAAAIADVHTRSWQGAYAHVFGPEVLASIDVDRRAAGWERNLADDRGAVFVAESDGGVVAFVSVGPSRDDDAEGELYAIYALPETWGRGLGYALMAPALESLRESGHRDAILWVLDDNPRARAFYEREGWTLDGAEKVEEFLGTNVREVRYRIALA